MDMSKEQDALDAARYRWLRAQHWSDSKFCIVVSPKQAVKLGYDCPSMERLDEAIDAARLECAGDPTDHRPAKPA